MKIIQESYKYGGWNGRKVQAETKTYADDGKQK